MEVIVKTSGQSTTTEHAEAVTVPIADGTQIQIKWDEEFSETLIIISKPDQIAECIWSSMDPGT